MECYEALQMFSNGKASGNHSLTADFYKGFWNLLGHQLTDALNYSYEHRELSNSQKNNEATIGLIGKKDRDSRYIKNWRPISLLNVEVKIASKALAIRLVKVLPEMEYTQIEQIPRRMVSFDFEKAFDSLSWSFLYKALNSFNFGKSFISWVSVLSCNISSCINSKQWFFNPNV